jgi:NAD+ kinase
MLNQLLLKLIKKLNLILLYDKNRSLQKKIKIEQIRNETS